MKYIIALLFAMFAVMAQAQTVTIDVGKLPAELKEQVQKATEVAKQNVTAEKAVGVVDTLLTRMETFGKVAATGITSFAKELGVAAAEFATTPLGILLTVVLIMNYAGGPIIEFAVGCVFLFMILPIISWKTYKLFFPRMVVDKWEYMPVLWGLFSRRVPVESHEEPPLANDGESGSTLATIGVIAAVLSAVIGLVNFIPG